MIGEARPHMKHWNTWNCWKPAHGRGCLAPTVAPLHSAKLLSRSTKRLNKQISELGSVGLNVSCKRVLCSVLCTVYILFFMYMLNIYKIPSINWIEQLYLFVLCPSKNYTQRRETPLCAMHTWQPCTWISGKPLAMNAQVNCTYEGYQPRNSILRCTASSESVCTYANEADASNSQVQGPHHTEHDTPKHLEESQLDWLVGHHHDANPLALQLRFRALLPWDPPSEMQIAFFHLT